MMHKKEFLHQNAPHLPKRDKPFLENIVDPETLCSFSEDVFMLYEEIGALDSHEHRSVEVKREKVEQQNEMIQAKMSGASSEIREVFSVPTVEEAMESQKSRRSIDIPQDSVLYQNNSSEISNWDYFGGKKLFLILAITMPLIGFGLVGLTDIRVAPIATLLAVISGLIIVARNLDQSFNLHLVPRLRYATRFAFTTLVIFGVMFIGLNFNSYKQRAQYFFQGGDTTANSEQAEILETLLTEDKDRGEVMADKLENAHPDVNLTANLTNRVEELTFDGFKVSPPDERLIIPRLGKNVPIIRTSDSALVAHDWTKLEKDIQSDLEKGVVKYPGTANFGQKGNAFVTGHSSYYPWNAGRYKSVFALLDQVVVGDQVIVYSQGEKFVYRAKEIEVVSPERTDVLSQPKDESILTLMTCTPTGTTLKRLIIRFDQISPDPALNREPTINDGVRISSELHA